MLHTIDRTSITLEPDDLLELEQIVTDKDTDLAFEFPKNTIYTQIDKAQRAYSPISGTIGHRANKLGYKHLEREKL